MADCGGPGFLALSQFFRDLSQEEQVRLVRQAWQQDIPRLLVFDNCEDPTLIHAWAPPTGGCRVLITSRRQHWPSSLRVQTQSLEVLARQSSIALLQQLSPRLTNAEADTIAIELGDLPLALQLAGTYLAQFGRIKVSTYLAELTSDVILKHSSLQGTHDDDMSLTNHDRHVGRTFLVSYRHLKPSDPIDALALQLLGRAACLAPGEPIPVDLLLATTNLAADSIEGQRALQRLTTLGLLIGDTTSVQIHRLVVAFVQSVLQDGAAFLAVEHTIGQFLEKDHEIVVNIVPHIRMVATRLTQYTNVRTMKFAERLASLFYALNDGETALSLYQWLLHVMPDIPMDRADILYRMGLVYGHKDTDRAITTLVEALTLHRHLCGSKHLAVAADEVALAQQLIVKERFGEAEDLLHHSLTLRREALTQLDPQVFECYDALFHLFDITKQISKALLLERESVNSLKGAIEHAQTKHVRLLNNLARHYYKCGAYRSAEMLFRRVLAICEQALGPTHPDTAQSLINLAELLKDLRGYAGALPLYERALAIREQALGPDHPATASSLNNLAYLLNAMGNSTGARPLYERALAIQEQALGPTHPNTAGSLNNLALLLDATGDYGAARPLYERATAILEAALGPDHPTTASSLNNLALLLKVTGDYAGALPLYERALAIREQALGSDHPDTVTARDNLLDLNAAIQRAPGADQEHPATAGDPDHDAPPQA